MKILYIIGSVGVAGAEEFLFDLTTHLPHERFQSRVCALRIIESGKSLRQEFLDRQIPVTELTKSYLTFLWIFKLFFIILRYRPDVIHTYLFVSNFFGAIFGKMCGVPVIIVSKVANDSAWQKWYHRIAEKLIVPLVDQYIVDGEAVKRYNLERIKIPADKVILIHTTINPEKFMPTTGKSQAILQEFHISADRQVVGFIGRFHPQKDPKTFVLAAKKVLDENRNALFMMVGYGALEKELKQLAAELGIEKGIIFPGLRRDLANLYNTFDIFVNSSIYEGLPLVIMQALLMKKPVIATDVDGNSEIIQNYQSGILVPPGDPTALAKAITALLADASLREKLGQNGRTVMLTKFSLTNIVQQIVNLYESLYQLKLPSHE